MTSPDFHDAHYVGSEAPTDEQTLAKIRKRDARRVELVDAFGLRQTTEGEMK